MTFASCQTMAPSKLTFIYRSHLRAWREFRGMTQEELGDAVGTSGSVISLLEAGKRQLTNKWLNRLAGPLRTSPGFILEHDPKNLPVDLLDIWSRIPEDQREVALRVLQTFANREELS